MQGHIDDPIKPVNLSRLKLSQPIFDTIKHYVKSLAACRFRLLEAQIAQNGQI